MSENSMSEKKPNKIQQMMSDYSALSGRDKWRYWGNFLINNALYIAMLILVIYVAIKFPPGGTRTSFLSWASLIDILKKSATSLFMALGIAGCVVLTGTDLSAGRMMGFTAVICASLLQRSDYSAKIFENIGEVPIALVLLLVIAVGAFVGMVNGFFVSKFSLHPFIVTLATSLMIQGVVLIYLQLGNGTGQALSGLRDDYGQFVKGSILSIQGNAIPNYVWYAIIMTAVMWVIWNKTTLGKNMYAVGSNPEAANVSGVNVAMTTILVFTLAGILYGISGFIQASYIGSNDASTGVGYEMDAIAACVIGGVSFTGGVGKISGIVTGVIMLNLISVCLQWLSVSANLQYIIKGIIILAAVSIDMQKYLTKK